MDNIKSIKKRYILMSILLIGLALLLLILPERDSSKELEPEKLLFEIIDKNHFVTTDYVADRIINNDNYVILIDIRQPEEFANFSLPGAINIPLNNILDKTESGEYKWKDYLNNDTKKNIFYSNGNTYSNQAWMITRRLNYKNNYIMEGGLNKWKETILDPQRPKNEADNNELTLYNFRKAAKLFFVGGDTKYSSDDSETVKNKPAPIINKNNKKNEDEGGC